jgi:hypothetical protein
LHTLPEADPDLLDIEVAAGDDDEDADNFLSFLLPPVRLVSLSFMLKVLHVFSSSFFNLPDFILPSSTSFFSEMSVISFFFILILLPFSDDDDWFDWLAIPDLSVPSYSPHLYQLSVLVVDGVVDPDEQIIDEQSAGPPLCDDDVSASVPTVSLGNVLEHTPKVMEVLMLSRQVE